MTMELWCSLPGERMEILCVEDEKAPLERLENGFRQHAPHLSVAYLLTNGQDAIGLIRKHQPLVVILDMNMPHPGTMVLKEIQQAFASNPENKPGLIVYSQFSAFKESAEIYGVLDYILKSDGNAKDVVDTVELVRKYVLLQRDPTQHPSEDFLQAFLHRCANLVRTELKHEKLLRDPGSCFWAYVASEEEIIRLDSGTSLPNPCVRGNWSVLSTAKENRPIWINRSEDLASFADLFPGRTVKTVLACPVEMVRYGFGKWMFFDVTGYPDDGPNALKTVECGLRLVVQSRRGQITETFNLIGKERYISRYDGMRLFRRSISGLSRILYGLQVQVMEMAPGEKLEEMEWCEQELIRQMEEMKDVSDLMDSELNDEDRQHPVSAAEIVQRTVDRVTPWARAQGVSVQLQLDSEPVPWLPLHGVQVALTALLRNAVESHQANPDPRLDHCRVDVRGYRSNGSYIMEVKDNGMGLPSGVDQKAMMRPDWSGKGGNRGFGLYFSERIAQEIGGTLELKSADEAEWSTLCRMRVPVPSAGVAADHA